MSFKVTKLTVGKGRTVGDEKAGEWTKKYFEIEAVIEDEHVLEMAKGSLEALLDSWVSGKSLTQEDKPKYDLSKIRWESAEGTRGPYEKSVDVDGVDFKNLMKDVQEHGGKMSVGEFFVWAFQNGATLGRKKRRK